MLSVPVLAVKGLRAAVRWMVHPIAEFRFRRQARRIWERIHVAPRIHAPEILERVKQLGPDLGLIYGGPILRPELFGIPAMGTLGIHHGTLPHYRGKKTTFWEMYNGEATAGVTIQRVNAGIDTGEVVLRGAVNIGRKRYGKIWHEVQRLGVDLYVEAILQIRLGTATFEAEEGPKGCLYRDPSPAHILGLWFRRPRPRT